MFCLSDYALERLGALDRLGARKDNGCWRQKNGCCFGWCESEDACFACDVWSFLVMVIAWSRSVGSLDVMRNGIMRVYQVMLCGL